MTTNTDINELARQLRDSAQLALTAPDNNRCRNSDDRARRIGMLRPLRDLCNPANILLILDALEAAQQYAKSRDEENQDLMLTIGRLRVERELLEASQPVITSQDDDPMRTNFTCDLHQTDYGLALYFTRLGLPENVHQLYRNEAEALYLGLKSALCKAAPALQEGE